MRQSTKTLFTVLLLATGVTWAQVPSLDSDLLVRLSYERWPGQQICISVSQAGDYRIVSPSHITTDPVLLKGKMADNPLLHLKKLLAAHAFRSIPANHAGMIRDHAENFRAEVWRVEMPPAFRLLDVPTGHPRTPPGPPRRMHWLNADDESPFPAPIARLIEWMENFKPKNAKPSDNTDFSDVCPSVGLSYVQPSVASSDHR
ncbi:MAG TPA: hypothetical protein VMG82_31540 [Candidatus Sulfotelmatobacter sp.]|nr:hypothetical protein [Candidatus Sulfotelmatobacter sp.]